MEATNTPTRPHWLSSTRGNVSSHSAKPAEVLAEAHYLAKVHGTPIRICWADNTPSQWVQPAEVDVKNQDRAERGEMAVKAFFGAAGGQLADMLTDIATTRVKG